MSRKTLDVVGGEDQGDGVKMMPCGVRIRFSQIPLSIFDEINREYRDDDPPEVEIKEKSEPDNPWMESNPNDPDYIKYLEANGRERGAAIIDAVIILGTELLDPMPEDGWIQKLRYLEKVRGIPKLSDFDLEDPMEKEFVFKKFYAIGRDGMDSLLALTGVTEEGIDDAISSFPGDEERSPDTDA